MEGVPEPDCVAAAELLNEAAEGASNVGKVGDQQTADMMSGASGCLCTQCCSAWLLTLYNSQGYCLAGYGPLPVKMKGGIATGYG
jgi:hypothetical protein